MIKLLVKLFGGYLVREDQYLGPCITYIHTVNSLYNFDSVVLSLNETVPYDKNSVYFTKFFAERKLRKMEKALAEKLAKAEAERIANGEDALELEL
jgi:hypothetical protein